jgi:hypothetical protein
MIQDALPNGGALVSSEESRVSMELVDHGQRGGKRSQLAGQRVQPATLARWQRGDVHRPIVARRSEYSVYVRKTDGSPAVKIGSGEFGASLSPGRN